MTLIGLLDGHGDDAPALIEGHEVTSYGELRSLVAGTRAGLVAAGVDEGDRVGIHCTNSRSSVVAIMACVTGGMVAVPLDPTGPAPELIRQLDDIEATMLLTGSPIPEGVFEPIATPRGSAVEGVDPLPEGPEVDPAEVDDDTLALMLFTSGTAGSPKAAMLSHGNLTVNQLAIINHPGSEMNGDAVVLGVLPTSHMYGLNVSLLTTLRAGGTVVLAEGFDPLVTVDLITRHGVTHFAGVPPMWRAFVELPDIPADAFQGVVRMASGAAALPPSLWTQFRDRFGVELSEGYGLTETSPGVTAHIGIEVRPGSVGKPLPGVEVLVVDHDGNPAPPFDSGEILVRGPNVFLGYWQDLEATKAVLDDDGWLHTGDVGVFSEDGYLALVDRAKDLIIVSGFNVYPFEVEAVLTRHPAVSQTVVIGRDDEQRGERVVAFITLNEGAVPPELDDVVAFCRQELARYKCPSELHVVEELPIAPSGKRRRKDLI